MTWPLSLPLHHHHSSGVHIHSEVLVTRSLLNNNKLLHILLADNLLVQIRSGAPRETVIPRLLTPLVWLLVVTKQLRWPLLRDHTDIDIATRSQVVEDTGLDGLRTEADRLVPREVRLPRRFENGHGSQRT